MRGSLFGELPQEMAKVLVIMSSGCQRIGSVHKEVEHFYMESESGSFSPVGRVISKSCQDIGSTPMNKLILSGVLGCQSSNFDSVLSNRFHLNFNSIRRGL